MRYFLRIIIFIGLLVSSYTQAFSASRISNIDSSQNVSMKEESTILDGMIGPYDPTDTSASDPDFSQVDDLEGTLPDNYYTISVSVPIYLQFTAVSERFFAPTYLIENRATRPVYVMVTNVVEESIQENSNLQRLYLRTPDNTNNQLEIDVSLSMETSNSGKKTVRLSDFSSQTDRYLGYIGLKGSATLTFESSDWEIPGKTAPNKPAKSKCNLELTFSLDAPTNQGSLSP